MVQEALPKFFDQNLAEKIVKMHGEILMDHHKPFNESTKKFSRSRQASKRRVKVKMAKEVRQRKKGREEKGRTVRQKTKEAKEKETENE